MIKSREFQLTSTGDDAVEVLSEAVEFGNLINLGRKDSLMLRLLTEETMSMLRTLTGEVKCELTFVEENGVISINLETDTIMDANKRSELLAASKSGKNSFSKGIMGKVREAFEVAFTLPAGVDISNYCTPSMMMGVPYECESEQVMDTLYWSLSTYRKNLEENDVPAEQWDELEKSIVSNIAEDVQVGIRGEHVVMAVIYKIRGE
ncbi:MAG: hypothetical protein J6127_01645 [Clostridiales bacterium]|nr:hypothetical protein [Clostridiales bacterium]